MWVTPLAQKGLFESPPAPMHVEGHGFVFPHWPASVYLARMAKHIPSEVASIFSRIDTENVFVVGNIIDGALAMPASDAAKVVPAVCRAARAGRLWIHFDRASDLCVHLANAGQVTNAIVLAEALFEPRFDENPEHPKRRDDYWYEQGLKKVVPSLARAKPKVFLPKISKWLEQFVQARELGSRYSWLLRPAIEEHKENAHHGTAGAMVGFARQAVEEAIRHGGMSLEEVLEILSDHFFSVFRRIRVHLIGEFAEQNPALARQTMMDRGLFDDEEYKHEYSVLVARRLDLLTPEERTEWFGWIDAGPDMSHIVESEERGGRHPTEEELKGRKEYWQFEKLHCVKEHLVGHQADFYQLMLQKHGEPEFADLNSRVGSLWSGPVSPISVEELNKLTFEAAVDRVSSWKPDERNFMGPDINGLADVFAKYLETNPETSCTQARVLIGKPSIYVRVFIGQMAEAIEKHRLVDVRAIIGLCSWVVGRPLQETTTPNAFHGTLIDENWQSARDEVSRFLRTVCDARTDGVSRYRVAGLREQLWEMVNALCHDKANSYVLHDTSTEDPRAYDYVTLGINSPRGKALKEMLDWQISDANRGFEALAIVGLNIGLIYRLDKDLVERKRLPAVPPRRYRRISPGPARVGGVERVSCVRVAAHRILPRIPEGVRIRCLPICASESRRPVLRTNASPRRAPDGSLRPRPACPG